MSSVLAIIWQIVLIVILPVLTSILTYAAKTFIDIKIEEIKDKKVKKVLSQVTDTIINSVDTVQQTFVEDLKKNGEFTKAAQEQALEKASQMIREQLTNEVKQVIVDNYNDIEMFITSQIESYIKNGLKR